ncbi:MAG: ABC transporter permease [Candidatus Nanoarchaeia archaeon]|nr:ABC transporter permease [Candidatus Nanoarchaeia archaeon]MDD5588213.1 ABC transporter permease [Candidatus Nanoarchaeia archaeon]
MILDFITLAFTNLKKRQVRSWLTMLGIFIGIAAVVSLISLGQGLQDAISKQFETLGSDKITITAGAGLSGPPGSGFTSAKITQHDVDLIEKIGGIKGVVPINFKMGRVYFDDQLKYTYVYGIPLEEDMRSIVDSMSNIKVADGRRIEQGDTNVVMAGYGLSTGDIFEKEVKVRDKLLIEDKKFEVVGTLETIGNKADDSAIFMPLDKWREVFNEPEIISMIVVQVQDGDNVNDIAEEIKLRMRKDRGLKEGEEDFNILTSEQLADVFKIVFGIVQAVLIGIAAISLVVGGIGIMNTMYTSVLERTKEIGIMKAIGAKNSDILTLFLLESGLLGLVGGLIGITLGVGISKVVVLIAQEFIGTGLLGASFPPILIVGALTFSLVIGSLSGMLPAIQASKLKPVDALRYE